MLTYIVWNSSKETMYRSLREDILDASKKSGVIAAETAGSSFVRSNGGYDIGGSRITQNIQWSSVHNFGYSIVKWKLTLPFHNDWCLLRASRGEGNNRRGWQAWIPLLRLSYLKCSAKWPFSDDEHIPTILSSCITGFNCRLAVIFAKPPSLERKIFL